MFPAASLAMPAGRFSATAIAALPSSEPPPATVSIVAATQTIGDIASKPNHMSTALVRREKLRVAGILSILL